jgi:hypothetical protein
LEINTDQFVQEQQFQNSNNFNMIDHNNISSQTSSSSIQLSTNLATLGPLSINPQQNQFHGGNRNGINSLNSLNSIKLSNLINYLVFISKEISTLIRSKNEFLSILTRLNLLPPTFSLAFANSIRTLYKHALVMSQGGTKQSKLTPDQQKHVKLFSDGWLSTFISVNTTLNKSIGIVSTLLPSNQHDLAQNDNHSDKDGQRSTLLNPNSVSGNSTNTNTTSEPCSMMIGYQPHGFYGFKLTYDRNAELLSAMESVAGRQNNNPSDQHGDANRNIDGNEYYPTGGQLGQQKYPQDSLQNYYSFLENFKGKLGNNFNHMGDLGNMGNMGNNIGNMGNNIGNMNQSNHNNFGHLHNSQFAGNNMNFQPQYQGFNQRGSMAEGDFGTHNPHFGPTNTTTNKKMF